MTSTTHHGDALASPRRALVQPRRRSWVTLVQGLTLLAALGVLVLLLEGHGLSWLAGLVAGASTTGWLVTLRAQSGPLTTAPVDHGDADIREELRLLEPTGWGAIHDLDARYARYRHVAIGPGGVILLQSQRLARAWHDEDPSSQRELLILRRRALSATANLRREIEDATGQPAWVQAVVVVWSEFSAGCLQDGRCVFVSGPRLVEWLRRRPDQLPTGRAAEIHAALARLAATSVIAAAPVAA